MPGLLTEPVQDRGLAVVALDQLRQVRVKARRPHARTPRADGEQGDGLHRSSQADVETLKLATRRASSARAAVTIAPEGLEHRPKWRTRWSSSIARNMPEPPATGLFTAPASATSR